MYIAQILLGLGTNTKIIIPLQSKSAKQFSNTNISEYFYVVDSKPGVLIQC